MGKMGKMGVYLLIGSMTSNSLFHYYDSGTRPRVHKSSFHKSYSSDSEKSEKGKEILEIYHLKPGVPDLF